MVGAQQSVSAEDRSLFIERVRGCLDSMQRSARWLERNAELGSGTVSKIAKGQSRTVLDERKLQAIAAALGVTPQSLVTGTAYEALGDDSATQKQARALAEAEATVNQLSSEADARERKNAELAAQNAELAAANAKQAEELTKLRAVRASGVECLKSWREAHAKLKGQLGELVSQRDWALQERDRAIHNAEEAGNAAASYRQSADSHYHEARRSREALSAAHASIVQYQEALKIMAGWHTRAMELEKELIALKA